MAITFDPCELAEDLALLDNTCTWCTLAAPGDSQRCSRHQARKAAPLERVCKGCGKPFTIPASRLQGGYGERGGFCTGGCKLRWQSANDPRFPSGDTARAAEGRRARFERIGAELADTRPRSLTALAVADAARASVAAIRACAVTKLGAELLVVDGAWVLAFPLRAAEAYLSLPESPATAGLRRFWADPKTRRRWIYRVHGHRAPTLLLEASAAGKRSGSAREQDVDPGALAHAERMLREGRTIRDVAVNVIVGLDANGDPVHLRRSRVERLKREMGHRGRSPAADVAIASEAA